MFREMRRQDKKLSMEDCIKVLKEETRGVLSVIGDDYILGDIEAQGMETLLLVLTPDHISGKLVNES